MTTTTKAEYQYDVSLRAYVDVVQSAHDAVSPGRTMVSVDRGRRFDRIVLDNGVQRSVHAFVDRTTGNVLKAAGWKAPQRSREGVLAVRYNLSDLDTWKNCVDPFGGYLYERL